MESENKDYLGRDKNTFKNITYRHQNVILKLAPPLLFINPELSGNLQFIYAIYIVLNGFFNSHVSPNLSFMNTHGFHKIT